MRLDTVIFDMDGLLIDSEPLWQEAGKEVLSKYGCSLTSEQYESSTGLRTKEWLEHWFRHFELEMSTIAKAETRIIDLVLEKIKTKGQPLPGAQYIVDYFRKKGFKVGLATSSPLLLAHQVVQQLQIAGQIDVITSAEHLAFGKPHPQVYLECAQSLQAQPFRTICFEDSVNGMVAAKAARMKCVVVPGRNQQQLPAWGLADLRISSLQNFNDLLLSQMHN